MRYVRKQSASKSITRKLITSILISVILLGSVVTAVANSVDITVFDGEKTYAFSMIGADAESILSRAETEGMDPLSEIDECVFSESSTVLTIQRNVRVALEVDGETQMYVVEEGSVLEDILNENSIVLGERDEITPAADTVLEQDTQVKITRSVRVFVNADGATKMVDRFGGTVSDALEAAGVAVERGDIVEPAEDTKLENGMEITVQRMVNVTVQADGEEITAKVVAASAEEAVEEAGVALGNEDALYFVYDVGEVLVPRGTTVQNDVTIRVERIETETVTETEVLPYETEYKEVDNRYKDEEKTVTRGVNGEKQVTYKVTYADGVEISREAVSEEVVKEAVDAVVERGTKARADAVGNKTFVDHTGTTVGYDWAITGECTAYSWEAGSVTSMGTSVQHGYVAVNPNVIPYGSLLYITSPYGEWNYGYCYAMDTGGAAMSGRIVADLFYDSEDYCNEFGRRQMTVYVVEESKWPDGWK